MTAEQTANSPNTGDGRRTLELWLVDLARAGPVLQQLERERPRLGAAERGAILAHTPRAVAEDWEKLLSSAVANAEHNHELLGDDLRILTVTADEGPTIKRFRPRAMGRATRIRKRTSHLTITLTPKE